jgi:hypothetical protein
MILNLRSEGPYSLVVGLIEATKHAVEVARADCALWNTPISKLATDHLRDVGARIGNYKARLEPPTPFLLRGEVWHKSKEGRRRHVVIERRGGGQKTLLECLCCLYEDNGIVCVHLAVLLAKGKLVLPKKWVLWSTEFVSFSHSTVLQQAMFAEEFYAPVLPGEIYAESPSARMQLDKMLDDSIRETGSSTLPMYPGRQFGKSGMPKKRKARSKGPSRVKSVLELSKKRRRAKIEKLRAERALEMPVESESGAPSAVARAVAVGVSKISMTASSARGSCVLFEPERDAGAAFEDAFLAVGQMALELITGSLRSRTVGSERARLRL